MKVAFTDFWWKFDENQNFFTDSIKNLTESVEIVKSSDADIVFFSCFGKEHEKVDRSKTLKVYYTGENLRPPLQDCDYSLTFDYEDYGGKNHRLPLWMLQIDWWKTGGKSYTNPQFVIPLDQLENNNFRSHQKKNFCSAVFNRDALGLRRAALTSLSSIAPISCYGEPWGNWFYGEDVKLDVISNYRFALCFENSDSPGYYTEKPIHARIAGCIPIYWSNKQYVTDFNPDGFINLCDFNSLQALTEKVREIEASEILRNKMLDSQIFSQEPKIDAYTDFLTRILKRLK